MDDAGADIVDRPNEAAERPAEIAAARSGWTATTSPPGWRRHWPLVPICGVSLVVKAWGLGASEWGNAYYAAAVRSMRSDAEAFFFAGFDSGGYVTVDKDAAVGTVVPGGAPSTRFTLYDCAPA